MPAIPVSSLRKNFDTLSQHLTSTRGTAQSVGRIQEQVSQIVNSSVGRLGDSGHVLKSLTQKLTDVSERFSPSQAAEMFMSAPSKHDPEQSSLHQYATHFFQQALSSDTFRAMFNHVFSDKARFSQQPPQWNVSSGNVTTPATFPTSGKLLGLGKLKDIMMGKPHHYSAASGHSHVSHRQAVLGTMIEALTGLNDPTEFDNRDQLPGRLLSGLLNVVLKELGEVLQQPVEPPCLGKWETGEAPPLPPRPEQPAQHSMSDTPPSLPPRSEQFAKQFDLKERSAELYAKGDGIVSPLSSPVLSAAYPPSPDSAAHSPLPSRSEPLAEQPELTNRRLDLYATGDGIVSPLSSPVLSAAYPVSPATIASEPLEPIPDDGFRLPDPVGDSMSNAAGLQQEEPVSMSATFNPASDSFDQPHYFDALPDTASMSGQQTPPPQQAGTASTGATFVPGQDDFAQPHFDGIHHLAEQTQMPSPATTQTNPGSREASAAPPRPPKIPLDRGEQPEPRISQRFTTGLYSGQGEPMVRNQSLFERDRQAYIQSRSRNDIADSRIPQRFTMSDEYPKTQSNLPPRPPKVPLGTQQAAGAGENNRLYEVKLAKNFQVAAQRIAKSDFSAAQSLAFSLQSSMMPLFKNVSGKEKSALELVEKLNTEDKATQAFHFDPSDKMMTIGNLIQRKGDANAACDFYKTMLEVGGFSAKKYVLNNLDIMMSISSLRGEEPQLFKIHDHTVLELKNAEGKNVFFDPVLGQKVNPYQTKNMQEYLDSDNLEIGRQNAKKMLQAQLNK